MTNFLKRLGELLSRIFSINFLLSVVKLPSAILLILVNLIPMAGVLFWGWNPYDIVFLYWVENIVIGIFNFFRIFLAQGNSTDPDKSRIVLALGSEYSEARRLGIPWDGGTMKQFSEENPHLISKFLAVFFLAHYGLFTFVHGVFVSIFFASKSSFIVQKDFSGLIIFFVALLISHGFSFFYNYIYKKEYLERNPVKQMMVPYVRIFPIHLTIIFGAMIASILPNIVVIFFIILKILFDLGGHIGSHIGFKQKGLGEEV